MDPIEKVTDGVNAMTGLTKAVKDLGLDPCLLTNVFVVVCCMIFMAFHMKHLEKMEEIRLKQFKKLKTTK